MVTGSIVGCCLCITELFVSLGIQESEYEAVCIYVYWNRATGPYAWAYLDR